MGLIVRPSWQDDLLTFKLKIDNIVYASTVAGLSLIGLQRVVL
jgi:hypothetical protein